MTHVRRGKWVYPRESAEVREREGERDKEKATAGKYWGRSHSLDYGNSAAVEEPARGKGRSRACALPVTSV